MLACWAIQLEPDSHKIKSSHQLSLQLTANLSLKREPLKADDWQLTIDMLGSIAKLRRTTQESPEQAATS